MEQATARVIIHCPACSRRFQTRAEYVGRNAKCPACEQVIEISSGGASPPQVARSSQPAAAAGTTGLTASPSAENTARPQANPVTTGTSEQIFAAFVGSIEPVRRSSAYRLSVLLVAIVMVLLPLCYVGLIVLVGYGIYYHAVNHTGLITMVSGRAAVYALLLYLSPMLVGPILILFMIKPLFTRLQRPVRQRWLNRKSEPLLFDFVDRICHEVGAPRPKRVDVDCLVNASASFRHGIWSIFWGGDLVLTIGLPLVAGLSLRQFAGVLAHEFGHFSQGAGMRLTYLVRAISFWFTRVVYERDRWDDWLVGASQRFDFRISWIFFAAQGFVWVIRKVLWVFMMAGHGIAGVLLRQMEFDADRYEARLAGSKTFAETVHRLNELNLSMQMAYNDMSAFYRDGKLGDDLPALVMAKLQSMPDELRHTLRRSVGNSTTHWLDTHPADADRIANAAREASEGIFRLEIPASVLFSDFAAQSQATTMEYYRGLFGRRFNPRTIRPLRELIRGQARESQDRQAAARLFQGAWLPTRPLALPGGIFMAPGDADRVLERLQNARQRILDLACAARSAAQRHRKADDSAVRSGQLVALGKIGIRPAAAWTEDLPFAAADCERAYASAVKNAARSGEELTDFLSAVSDRLVAGCEWLHTDHAAEKLSGALARREEVERLLTAGSAILGQVETLVELRNEHALLSCLLSHVQGNEQNSRLAGRIERIMESLAISLRRIWQLTVRVPYPFEHTERNITLGQYALPSCPTRDDLQGIYNACDQVLNTFFPLLMRIIARLAFLVEEVEAALGLPPLPDPPTEATASDGEG